MLKNIMKFAVQILLLTVIHVYCNVAQALSYAEIGNIYFFGDSLSDGGFNDLWPTVGSIEFPPLPSGKAPTFTTLGGYTWAQYVARDIKGILLPIYPGPAPADIISNNSCCVVPGFSSGTLTGFNFAAAGSTTNSIGVSETWAPSLHTQVQTFVSTHTIAPNDVFFIWEGANDLLAVLNFATTELDLLIAANVAATNIANEVALLSARGAKRFVILSLPNIGRAPLISQLGIPGLAASIKNISFTFNGMLNQALGRIIARYQIKVLYVNAYSLLDKVIDIANAGGTYYVQGQGFRFTNTTDPVCGNFVSAVYCQTDSNQHVFADALHPTDMTHRLLALQIETYLQQWK